MQEKVYNFREGDEGMNDKKSLRKKVVEATPIFCLIVFLAVGFCFDAWHPGWLVFVLIPIMPFLVGYKKIKFTYGSFIAVAYVAVGLIFKVWHPTWIIFLTIPIYHIFVDKE